jgi:protein-tyrosine phosphatase
VTTIGLIDADVPPSPERHIRLAGTRNLRDVGGYPAAGGRRTRWRTLFRTDRLDRIAPDAQARLLDLGVRQVIDLRWPHELAAEPNVFARSSRVRYRHIALLEDNPPEDGIAAVYMRMVDERGAQLAEVVRALLAPSGLPAMVGCAAGKDRTGVTIAVLLSAVGVSRDVVVGDYVLSTECFATPAEGADRDDPIDGAIEVDCDPAFMEATLDHVEARWGGARGLLEANGVTGEELGRLAGLLTERERPAGP